MGVPFGTPIVLQEDPTRKKPSGICRRALTVKRSNLHDLPRAPHQQQCHDRVDELCVLLVKWEQDSPQRRPDQVTRSGADRHDGGKGKDMTHMEPVGQNEAGIEGDAQHHDLDVQDL